MHIDLFKELVSSTLDVQAMYSNQGDQGAVELESDGGRGLRIVTVQ